MRVLGAILLGCGPTEPAAVRVTIDGVTLVRAPESALVITVSWKTDRPATSIVEFGDAGALEWQISDPTPVTDHQIIVAGLHADRHVNLRVRSAFDDGTETVVDDLGIRTGSVPASVPRGVVETYDAAQTQPGWTLMNISNADLGWPPTAVIYDPDGQPVWYAVTSQTADQRGDLDVSLTEAGTILVGGSKLLIHPVELSLDGSVLWNGPAQEAPEQHHHFQRLGDGTTALLRQSLPADRPGLRLDRVEVIDPAHSVTWSWDAADHVDPPDGTQGDWMHVNSVTFTDSDVYVSSRNLDTLYRIDRASGDIVWRLGANGDFAPDPAAPLPWFDGQHDPELQADGSWLFYDNQGGELGSSRVLQLAVDEERMTTEVLWTFPGMAPVDPWYVDDWHMSIWGDADRLANGNVLVTAGTRTAGEESRVFEVSPAGEVVWQMRLPSVTGLDVVGVYRSQRMDFPGRSRIER